MAENANRPPAGEQPNGVNEMARAQAISKPERRRRLSQAYRLLLEAARQAPQQKAAEREPAVDRAAGSKDDY